MSTQPGGTVLSFPTTDFRSLPVPYLDALGTKIKLSTFFVRVEDIPEELTQWMAVNPRIPKYDKNREIKSPVTAGMRETLDEEPEKFVLKNTGIFVIADGVEQRKLPGGRVFVDLSLKNPKAHGLVNGGHTLYTILQAKDERDSTEPWGAYVRMHVIEGVDDVDLVTDLAEGLNRSMQVDDPSLANLDGEFNDIKKVMKGKPGEDQIVYRQGDIGDVEILLVLTFMAMFDLETYPDRKTHPNGLFGHQKKVLGVFQEDKKRKGSSFKRILPKLPEILILSDRIQQMAFERCAPTISRMKLSDKPGATRAGAKKHKSRPAHFAGGPIGGKFQLGWLFPMLAAFRANVSREAWAKGKFEWIEDPEDLLSSVIEEMVEVIKTQHQDNKYKPAEVGRRDAAYRLCYSAVSIELAERKANEA